VNAASQSQIANRQFLFDFVSRTALTFIMQRLEMRFLLLLSAFFGLLLAGCVDWYGTIEDPGQYTRPLVSPGSQFASVPPAVQNTIRAQTGGSAISNITKDASSGSIVYRVDFINPGLLPPLFIAPDGSLLDQHLNVVIPAPADKGNVVTGGPAAGLTLNDLPPAVVKSIQARAPDSQVSAISRDVHGDQTTYFITFKDQMHPPLHLAADGTPLPDSAP
jgi:hypothetical protein